MSEIEVTRVPIKEEMDELLQELSDDSEKSKREILDYIVYCEYESRIGSWSTLSKESMKEFWEALDRFTKFGLAKKEELGTIAQGITRKALWHAENSEEIIQEIWTSDEGKRYFSRNPIYLKADDVCRKSNDDVPSGFITKEIQKFDSDQSIDEKVEEGHTIILMDRDEFLFKPGDLRGYLRALGEKYDYGEDYHIHLVWSNKIAFPDEIDGATGDDDFSDYPEDKIHDKYMMEELKTYVGNKLYSSEGRRATIDLRNRSPWTVVKSMEAAEDAIGAENLSRPTSEESWSNYLFEIIE